MRATNWFYWFYWIVLPLAWVVWHIAFRIRVVGRENLPRDGEGGFVLAPNHLSAIDPVFVVVARFWGRRMLVLGKEELFEINPFITWFLKTVNVIPVHRGRGDTAVVDKAIEDVRAGQGLLIFPEGTRSKDGSLGRLKSGAFVVASAAGVPMVPCRIIYKGGKMKPFCRCTVVFGKPIPAEALYLGEERSAARLRQVQQLLHDELERLLEENKQYL